MVGASKEAGPINLVITSHTYHSSDKEVTPLWPFVRDKDNRSDYIVPLSLKLKLKYFFPGRYLARHRNKCFYRTDIVQVVGAIVGHRWH
jgi:hypothetical protein